MCLKKIRGKVIAIINSCTAVLMVFILSLYLTSCNFIYSNNKGYNKEALIFLPDTLPSGKIGEPYNIVFEIENTKTPINSFRLVDGSIPPGLSLYVCGSQLQPCEDTFQLYGVPDTSGTFKFEIGVTCFGTNVSGQKGNKIYSIEVH